MLAQLMNKGTMNRTPAQLEEAIEQLGASISVRASDESLSVNASSLSRNYNKVMSLVSEILLKPRWDKDEFELLKKQTISRIQQQKASPRAIASNEFDKLIFGKDHILAQNNLGTEKSVANITLEDLKDYYTKYITPQLASFKIVGAIDQKKVIESLQNINENWVKRDVTLPTISSFPELTAPQIYFYDVPNAKQSILTFGNATVTSDHEDFYKTQILNYRLGGGGFASQLTQELREGKGYTYGIRSAFNSSPKAGKFVINSGVRSNVTFESTALIKEILSNYGSSFTEDDMEVTKSYLIKSSARSFESQSAKLRMLTNIDENNLPVDYAIQRQEEVTSLNVNEMKRLINDYIKPDKMIYLIVGDKNTQFNKLEKLGLGKPILLN